MTRKEKIIAHLAAHERKIKRNNKARLARSERNKRRGLIAAIKHLMEQAQ